jgi:E3 ubiquitin-protein ligase SHPRH
LTVYAQLQQKNQQDLARYHHALETLLAAEIEANTLIEDLKSTLENLSSQASKSKSLEQGVSTDKNGKGKERESSPASQHDEEEDIIKRNSVARGLREAEIILHKVMFFMGDLYHTLGAKYSKEEDSAYAKAELIRKKLLKGDLCATVNIILN